MLGSRLQKDRLQCQVYRIRQLKFHRQKLVLRFPLQVENLKEYGALVQLKDRKFKFEGTFSLLERQGLQRLMVDVHQHHHRP